MEGFPDLFWELLFSTFGSKVKEQFIAAKIEMADLPLKFEEIKVEFPELSLRKRRELEEFLVTYVLKEDNDNSDYSAVFDSSTDTLLKDIKKKNVENVSFFTEMYTQFSGSEAEKRTVTDQTLRDLIKEKIGKKDHLKSTTSVKEMLNIIAISVAVAKNGFCTPSMPFILLADILDCYTLDMCDQVFQYIEERVAIWKSALFYTAGKNYLLRMCNDLLRRLSQSQNTVFCGRIQLFLARLFPLSEKSALNLVSQFNMDNVTIFNKDAGKGPTSSDDSLNKQDESMEVDAIEVNAEEDFNIEKKETDIVDYKLYNDIWSLQDMFRYPVQCYNKDLWEKFVGHANSLFRVFSSFKLEDVQGSKRLPSTQQPSAHFSKFLTSEKLTNLQLNDYMFRRQVLTQFLILFQYLTSLVKFKSNQMSLTEAQKKWIKDTEKTIFEILDETPPNGKQFTKYIKHILAREEFWIAWKNESCPSFMKEQSKKQTVEPPALKRRKMNPNAHLIAEDFVAGRSLGMGSPELTRLWNLCPDNLQACRSASRGFVPSLKDFFGECIEQEDPKNQIEDQYKLVKNSNFQWKALRLLSKRSQLFFMSQPAQMQFKDVPDYLSTIVKKLEKEFPKPKVPESELPESTAKDETSKDSEMKPPDTVPEEDANGKDAEGDDGVLDADEESNDLEEDESLLAESQDENEEASEEPAGAASDSLTSDDVTSFATKIGAEWKKLAPHLGIKDKDVKEIEGDSDDVVLQARQTLVTWQDHAKSGATKTSLLEALKAGGIEV